MPRCCQFSEDRKEPSAGRSRSATDKLWRHRRGPKISATRKGANSLGHSLGVAPQLRAPCRGCSFVASPISYPKELARDRREFFNSLLGRARSRGLIRCGRGVPARSLCSKELGNCLANTGTATSDDSDPIIQHEIQSAAGGTFRVSHNLELSLGPSGLGNACGEPFSQQRVAINLKRRAGLPEQCAKAPGLP